MARMLEAATEMLCHGNFASVYDACALLVDHWKIHDANEVKPALLDVGGFALQEKVAVDLRQCLIARR